MSFEWISNEEKEFPIIETKIVLEDDGEIFVDRFQSLRLTEELVLTVYGDSDTGVALETIDADNVWQGPISIMGGNAGFDPSLLDLSTIQNMSAIEFLMAVAKINGYREKEVS